MGESKAKYFILNILLLFVLVGMITLVFNLRRFSFAGELFILIIIILFSFISLIGVYGNKNWGFVLLMLVFTGILIDLGLIYFLKGVLTRGILWLVILSAIGFIISVAGIKRKETVYSDDYDDDNVYTNFEPGKYVASNRGTVYHSPKCDWAQKIGSTNRVWFDSEQEAKKKGLKKHSCL